MTDAVLADASPSLAKTLPMHLALELSVLVVAQEADLLTIACAEELTHQARQRLERATGRSIVQRIVARHVLMPEIARCYGTQNTSDESDERTIVELVNDLLRCAMLERASDLHFDRYADGLIVRMRVDGLLRQIAQFDAERAVRIISRIKLISGMDIAERRLPQDGRLTYDFEQRKIDVRVASLPTHYGERLALRCIDPTLATIPFDALGMSEEHARKVRQMLGLSGGLLLISGPTGSGKTTTLYALMRLLDAQRHHICTVEDPIERHLAGVSQVAVQPRSGLHFATILRALLRQDPDTVMIGEIRDEETARTAVHAALAGQRILASIHSPDAENVVTRLREFGVVGSSLAAVLSGIVAQRLCMRLCIYCRASVGEAYKAVGCEHCDGSGYRGRAALFNVLSIDEEQRRQIATGSPLAASDTEREALERHLQSIPHQGISTFEEIQRHTNIWKMSHER